MEKIINDIVDRCCREKIIENDYKEVTAYGIRNLLHISMNLLISIIIGSIFNSLIYVVIFTVAFLFLRTYTGGYHNKTRWGCYLSSCILIVGTACFVQYVYLSDTIIIVSSIVCILLSFICIWKWSPVESVNKPLDTEERAKYAKISKRIFLLESFVVLLAIVGQGYKVVQTLVLAMVICGVLIFIEKCK